MKKQWFAFWGVIIVSFIVLGWAGTRIYHQKPPLPEVVKTQSGEIMIGPGQISDGQNVWQSLGGMEMGSVWGHGSYVAPDWTADYLHRECVFILNSWAQAGYRQDYNHLDVEHKAELRARLRELLRTNTYDPSTNTITVDPIRVQAFETNVQHYREVFVNGDNESSIPAGTLTDTARIRQLVSFYFWTSWAASTNRPGDNMSYTSNWPHEELIGNVPTSDAIIWTGFSIIMLLAGIGILVWFHASRKREPVAEKVPAEDPLSSFKPTPSQKAVVKYFWIVSGLFIVQIIMGVITAHFGVEGNAFYGLPIAKLLPYVITRTWHTQIGIFWIATAWLAAGLYIGPAVSGVEPKGQRLGVNILFGALLVVVLGSLIGEWFGIKQKLTGSSWFYFGHQGYEYVDLGRVWQIALLVGLFLWLYLVGRCIVTAIRKGGEQKTLMTMFLVSAVAIAAFYAAGLMWGKNTHLSVVEYWRWWVVHLWVEGFFEVFATVVIAFLFARLQLIRLATANQSVLFSTTIFLTGGIIGTLHHLYFAGTPTSIMALGAVFSALEVVPLTIIGFEAWDNIRLSRSTEWVKKYKWPIYFFVSVAFWNMVGAGLFGFTINPPIALYYMQGLNTTPVHGHTALFGVYGMLGLGLMLFCMRMLYVREDWKDGAIKFSFWTINGGLMLMVVLSLLPVGIMQTWASVEFGYWYARSAEFLYSPTLMTLKWLRAIGDTVFAVGAVTLGLFVFGLATGHSLKKAGGVTRSENRH
ncbi:nitric oxide reductase large subunit [candidate division GN15 bacterium]|uniref:Nitric oxide reductase large subunit n=1 Tax=candidate division GN15 bacterium TaxID=2072418 RepID=A0A855WWP3_9BACT|nr:MAG: nitric oxide reductase large subunit [candidate division GN15 bacterium]